MIMSADEFSKPTKTGNFLSDAYLYLQCYKKKYYLPTAAAGFIVGVPLLIAGAFGLAGKTKVSLGGNETMLIVGGAAMLACVISFGMFIHNNRVKQSLNAASDSDKCSFFANQK